MIKPIFSAIIVYSNLFKLKRIKGILLAIIFALALFSCNEKSEARVDFRFWYKKFREEEKSQTSSTKPEIYEEVYTSRELDVDGYTASMKGDMSIEYFKVDPMFEKLIWVTGYSVDLIENEETSFVSDEFMCHNNLNLFEGNNQPWKVYTSGGNIRLFTFSQGQTTINFPNKFAIPMKVPVTVSAISQVLNQNLPDKKTKISQKMTLRYAKDSRSANWFTPLYPQTIYVTKQIDGPVGRYGDPIISGGSIAHTLNDTDIKLCAVDYSSTYNPLLDDYGRKYTSHWTIEKDSLEVLETDVTPLMDLKFDTYVHFIAIHVHPFAQSLELKDLTTNESLFVSEIENYVDKIGIKKLTNYSSSIGFKVFKDHRYSLKSTYFDSDSLNVHTAMATMTLYMAEKTN